MRGVREVGKAEDGELEDGELEDGEPELTGPDDVEDRGGSFLCIRPPRAPMELTSSEGP